jgi:hypothetical protein
MTFITQIMHKTTIYIFPEKARGNDASKRAQSLFVICRVKSIRKSFRDRGQIDCSVYI